MKVLVTGAVGFFGSYIVRQLLEKGHHVIGLDIKSNKYPEGVEGVVADITQDLSPAVGEFDCAIHLAAIASPAFCDKNPAMAFNVNVNGTYNVLKLALQRRATRFILASSAHVYGISPKYLPTDERHPLWLQDTYTTTKLIGEQLCQLFYDNHGLGYVALRMFNGYGPGQPLGYFIPDQIAKAQKGRIDLRGSDITKDWVYVTDVADAFVRAVSSSFVGPVNIGTGIETDLGTIAKMIASVYKVELYPSPADMPTRMQSDSRRAKSVLGWTPTVSLKEGLGATIGTS